MKSVLTFLLLLGVGVYCYLAWQPQPPRPHRYSADDVFYLRQYVSVRTKKGIVGFLPGQEMRLNVGALPAPGKVMVTDGHVTLAIDRDLLTHDIDEADALQASDRQAQSALAAGMLLAKQSADQQNQVENAYTAEGINASNALQVSQNTVGNYQTRLNGDPQPGAYWGQYGGLVYVPTVVAGSAPAGARVPAGGFSSTPNLTPGASTTSSHTGPGAVTTLPVRESYNALSTHLNATDIQ